MRNRSITSGTLAVAYSVEIKIGAVLTVNNMGRLTINGARYFSNTFLGFTSALYNLGTIHNNGSLIVGNSSAIRELGMWNQAILNNSAEAEIKIDYTTIIGLFNGKGTFTNNGKIIVGKIGASGQIGLNSSGDFTNNSGGEITIERSTQVGLVNSGGTFNNFSLITIGATANAGNLGMQNSSIFNNNSGAEIKIDKTTTIGVYNAGSIFTNEAKITIESMAAVGGRGIQNEGSFYNKGCSALIDLLSNSNITTEVALPFINTGTIIIRATGTSSITSNTGIIQSLGSGTITPAFSGQIIPLNGTATSPSTVGGNNGNIRLSGLHRNTTYSFSYTVGNITTALSPDPTSNSAGVITIPDLAAGVYTVNLAGSCLPISLHLSINVLSFIPSLVLSTSIHPGSCMGNDGKISLIGLGFENTNQTLTYKKDGIVNTTMVVVGAGGHFTLSNLGSGVYSDFAIGNITAAGSKKLALYGALEDVFWTGCTNTDWNLASNWSKLEVPRSVDHVIITTESANQPVIGNAAVAKSVEIQTGSTLTIGNMGSLTLNGFKYNTDNSIGFTTAFFNNGTVHNNGQLIIGNADIVGQMGIWNSDTFNNYTDGKISIDRSQIYGLSNRYEGIFNNSGKINIGTTIKVGSYGLGNSAIFNNTGEIKIDRSDTKGLTNEVGVFTNAGKILIASIADVGYNGIENRAVFKNVGCSALLYIFSDGIIENSSGISFTNSGTIILNTTRSGSISSNSGIVRNLSGGYFYVGAGNQNQPLKTIATDPTTCNLQNGIIKIIGLHANTDYSLNYTIDGTTTTLSPTPTSSINGEITITNLKEGNYTITLGSDCLPVNLSLSIVLTAAAANQAPVISTAADVVCTGTEILISSNCPDNAGVLWSNGSTNRTLNLVMNSPTRVAYTAQCVFSSNCVSLISAPKTIVWKAFDLTFINVGRSKSETKTTPLPAKADWSNQFITSDAGPALDYSTEANPTIFHSENLNKTTPRFWTIQVETCALGTDGSISYDMLATPEVGVIRSYNTHENNAPYLMYANREGFTELYAQNHPAYGFYKDNGSGGNTYDAGFPKGLYKLSIRYWDQKGQGSIYPSTRQPAGNVLAYQEYWFRIQSKDGIGTGAGRQVVESIEGSFAQVLPNPVYQILRLKISEAQGQRVSANLIDASGRTILQRIFVPETNQHQEEFGVSHLTNGIYFMQVKTPTYQTTLKVIKAE